MEIVIINTGCANLSSVKFALDRLGYKSAISDEISQIKQADKLLLPGVGTAVAAMASLQQKNLIDIIKQVEQPVLGICLGMQLMVESSMEGNVDTLGLMKGKNEPIPDSNLPLPHMGWNTVSAVDNHLLFENIPPQSYFYFVHGYAVIPNQHTIATVTYGVPLTAALQYKNFYGVQFHPERSGKMGAQVLANFINNS